MDFLQFWRVCDLALIAPTISTIIAGNLAASGILGVSQLQLAQAISSGFVNYVLSSVIVTTADVGVLGNGSGFGQGLFLAPPVLQGALTTTFNGAGITGIFEQPLIFAIANSISQSLLSASILTTSISVGTGVGVVATLLPFSAISVPIMIGSFAAHGILGTFSAPLATAIALGIDASLPSSRGFTVVAGSTSPVPSAGVGIGKIV